MMADYKRSKNGFLSEHPKVSEKQIFHQGWGCHDKITHIQSIKATYQEISLLVSTTIIIFAIKIIINKNNYMKTSRFIWRIFLVPLVTMLCAFFVAPLQAQGQNVEAYVQMSADKTTLTFFYDTKRATREGTTWVINEKKLVDERLQYPTWVGTYENPNTTTTKAVIDASFKDFRPTSTAFWLRLFTALTNIEGLQNLNTSEVKRMAGMFDGCSALTSLDLSNFKTEKVNDMNSMFDGCSALTSLELSSFNTEKVTQMNKMFFGCSVLTSLNLSNFNTSNVTEMNGMFYGCSALKSLDLSSFNTSNVTDMNGMFYGCSGLTNLDLKNFNTLEVTDMGLMFKGCSALTSLDLSSFNTSNVTDMSLMFSDCSSLKALALKNFNTENVTDMTGMFISCSGLTSLDLSNFTTSNVTKMSAMFSGCSGLTSLNLKNFNTEKVKSMDNVFAFCSALTSLDLKNFNTENVTDMAQMFVDCSALTSLNLKNFNTEKVEDMNNMFGNCSALKSLDLKNFNTSNVTNMRAMFSSCSGLRLLNLKNFNTSNVTDMRWMFSRCSKLANIVCDKTWKCEQSQEMFEGCTALKGAVPYDESKVDVTMANLETGYFTKKVQDKPEVTTPEAYVQMSADKTTLTFFYDTKRASREGTTWGIEEKKEYNGYQYPAWAGTHNNPDTTTTKAVVDASFANFQPTSTASWFQNFKALTAIEGLQNLNTSEVIDMSGMFSRCSVLTSLDLKNFNTEKVENMSWMFNNCSALTTLDLKSFNTSNVKDMGYMFYSCSALTTLDLKNFNTSNVTDMGAMFFVCSSLTTLDISNFNTSNVTNMDLMFRDCSALTSLELNNFNTEKVENMSNMFAGCSSLTSLDLKSFNTEKVTDMRDMFAVSYALKTLDLKNFNTSEVTDMNGMFRWCYALTSLDLKNFNTEKVTDMRDMFEDCSQLASIVCDKAWKCEQSQNMFKGCTALKGAVAYDESKTDVTMANPETGYFTKKAQSKPEVTSPEAYVQMSADKTTLTFFYDNKRASREGTTWGIEEKKEFEGDQYPAWLGTYENPDTTITKAVVDASFANFRPTSTASWFQSFEALAAIEGLQNLNTSEVTNMRAMFNGCSRLTNLDLSSFNTSNVTDMGWMFNGCSALTSLDLKNFNTSNVTDMSLMFKDCSALKSLDLKNFNTSNVTDMSLMFNGCSGLKSLDLSNFNISKVTNMGGMFYGCSKLASIVCDKAWNSEYSYYMFKDCTALKGAVAYDESKTDVTMANPETGYFTKKAQDKPEVTTPEAYVQMSADKTTLTFFYDTKRATREGTTWGIEEKKEYNGYQIPAWAGTYEVPDTTTTKAVVDASFKDFRPTSTEYWFKQFKSLTAIEGLQNLNTSEVTDMSNMFYNCSALTSLDLKNFNTSNVTKMNSMFENCSALTSLNLSNFNTSNVTDMGWMFTGCKALTSLDIKNFNTQKVWNMREMFSHCSALTSLDLSSFNTSNVENIVSMFAGCESLTTLDLSNFNTSNVTDMGTMFWACSGLTTLHLTNFNTSNVKNMEYMFAYCSKLASIVCNKTWKSEKSQEMFKGCTALKGAVAYDANKTDATMANPQTGYFTKKVQDKPEVTTPEAYVQMSADKTTLTFFYDTKRASREGTTWGIEEKQEDNGWQYPAWTRPYNNLDTTTTKAVFDTSFKDFRPTSTAQWLLSLTALTNIEGLQNLNTSNVTDMDGMFWACSALTSLNLSNFNTSNVKNMSGMFLGCRALTSLNLSNFNTSNVTNIRGMFAGCRALTSLNLSNFNTSNVKDMSGMFENCSALTSLDLKGFKTEKVEDIQWMFNNCSALTSLELSNFNTSNVTNMRGMFHGCSGLTNLYLSNFNTSNVMNMSSMFADCSALTSLDLKSFNISNVTKMNSMFENCSALTSLNLSNFNTSNVTNMSGMFASCSALTALDLKNFNTSNVTNMSYMFSRCSALTSLDLTNFNTSNVTDMSGMFADCSVLTSLNLKNFNTEKVTNMTYMFDGCSQLVNIVSHKVWNSEYSYDMFKGCTALKGAVAFDENKTDVTMANPETGYFTKKVEDKPEVTIPQAYVQISADKTTLTFFYDTKRATREGTTWDITSPIATRSASLLHATAWGASEEKPNSTTTKVVFDASFAKFYPKTTAEWFAHYAALKRIEGIENLNTSEVTSMKGMFTGCAALDTLDLTTFNTEKVNDMSEMFKNCANLSTVVCDKVWSTPHSEQMFYGCVKLLGKAAFDANKTSVEMANPNSGYFVAVKPTALLPVFSPAGANGIYTLQGKRVRGNLQHLPAGVYIVNGKKVMVQ